MVEQLQELYSYCPQSGLITRKISTGRRWKAGQVAGSKNGQGYIEIKVQGKIVGAHRIAWMLYYNAPAPEFIDHINRDPSDNRICNLRAATKSQNGANRVALSNNKTGIKGCYFVKSKNPNMEGAWRAQCRVGKKLYDLGRHKTAEQAQAAYNEFAAKAFGDYYSPT
jgi:hypothetical protein